MSRLFYIAIIFIFFSNTESRAQLGQVTREGESSLERITDLSQLSPFRDIAVLQRRFLPKTGRVELFLAPSMVMNDAFFLNFGGNVRLGYYFRERYGIEFLGYGLMNTERTVTKDLGKLGVRTQALVTTKNYMGVSFKWSPIYGKSAFLNRLIVPFDFYFSLGGGISGTNIGDNQGTVHIGTGQIFAITQGMAFRWDFSWNFFQADFGDGEGGTQADNVFLSLGVSFFFPGVGYR